MIERVKGCTQGMLVEFEWLKPPLGKPVETGCGAGAHEAVRVHGLLTTAEAVAYKRARPLKRPERREHGVASAGHGARRSLSSSIL